MTTAILEQAQPGVTEPANPAGDPAAELRELFALDSSTLATHVTLTCPTHVTLCSARVICC
jgi:hypothetical protein